MIKIKQTHRYKMIIAEVGGGDEGLGRKWKYNDLEVQTSS